MAAKEKRVVDYNKMDLELFAELLNSLPEDKQKEFNAQQYVSTRPAKTKLVTKLDADGKPDTYINKNGKTKIRKEKRAIGTETVEYFNLMKAKRAFYNAFKDEFEWSTRPKESTKDKAKEKEEKTAKALASIGIKLN